MTNEIDNGPKSEEKVISEYVPPTEEKLLQIGANALEEVTSRNSDKIRTILLRVNIIAKRYLRPKNSELPNPNDIEEEGGI